MDKKFKEIVWVFMLLILPVALYAQKDVTQFLNIPVDGYKPEMIQKLKSKGFTTNQHSADVLEGEFNGTNVNIYIGTNNNKVWRIAVLDVDSTDETNIKIRFNNTIQQFANNERYSAESDSTIAKYIIPKEEDISYEILVNKKRYEATFYQNSLKFDSLVKEYVSINKEKDLIIAKDTANGKNKDRSDELATEIAKEFLNHYNKLVWFMIQEDNGKYRILIYYENEYNKANGEGL